MRLNPLLLILSALVATACGGSSGGTANRPPVADAGTDITTTENSVIQLAGRGSDADGDPMTYRWSQVSGPAVTFTSIGDPATTVAIPDVPVRTSEPVVLELQVTDSGGATNGSNRFHHWHRRRRAQRGRGFGAKADSRFL